MALLQSSLFVFYESPSNGGKWIPANVSLHSDGKFEVKVPDEDKTSFVLTSNCSVHAPMDSIWNKVPTVPFRRSIRETFGLQMQKDFVTWFLANSEEERNQWASSLTSVLSRKPPAYGDYDNWNHSQAEQPQTKLNQKKKPQQQSGFYSVERSNKTTKDSKLPNLEPRAGFYSVEKSTRNSLKDSNVPSSRQLTGFHSVEPSSRSNPNDPSKLQSPGFYSVEQSSRNSFTDSSRRASNSKLQSSGFYSVEQSSRNSLTDSLNSKLQSAGFYSVEQSAKNSLTDSSRRASNSKLQSSGFYSVEQSARNSLTEPSRLNSNSFKREPNVITKFPGSLKKSGFYSVQGAKGSTETSPNKKPNDIRDDDGRCTCCTSISACFCNIFALCCHQCCMNFASSI